MNTNIYTQNPTSMFEKISINSHEMSHDWKGKKLDKFSADLHEKTPDGHFKFYQKTYNLMSTYYVTSKQQL